MKRIWNVLATAVLCLSLAACNGANRPAADPQDIGASVPEASSGTLRPDAESQVEEENVPTSNEPAAGEQKILIAYFTWTDNTMVADPASVDVDTGKVKEKQAGS